MIKGVKIKYSNLAAVGMSILFLNSCSYKGLINREAYGKDTFSYKLSHNEEGYASVSERDTIETKFSGDMSGECRNVLDYLRKSKAEDVNLFFSFGSISKSDCTFQGTIRGHTPAVVNVMRGLDSLVTDAKKPFSSYSSGLK
jgi:hypothetical protein